MDLTKNDPKAVIQYFTPQHTLPQVACFSCGNLTESNSLGKCPECIMSTIDITEQAQKESQITFCKDCLRVLVPPNQWVLADRESSEMLSILLKRLDLGPQAKIVDAQFLWTEPHSRRTKVRLTIQKEESGVLLEQSYDVEFFENTMQCPQCAKSYTHNKWVANVQIRQHVEHKRTILWLEQLMLANQMNRTISSIEESREGMDLHYSFMQDARKMVAFLQQNAPVRLGQSSELISTNTHTSKSSYKFTFSVEIAPICRGDIVIVPKSLSHKKSNCPRLVICYKLNNSLHFVDPNTTQTMFVHSQEYWKQPFNTLIPHKGFKLTEFLVLCVEPTGIVNNKFVQADITIARMDDMNDEILVRTHLGGILKEGDTCLGIDFRTAQFNNDEFDTLKEEEVPDVIVVEKSYPEKEKKKRKVDRIAEHPNESEAVTGDYEDFLDEVEQYEMFE